LLADLDNRGVAVVLATSAPEDELATLREVLKVEATITDVTSADDVETAKPEPDVVHSALEKAKAEASASFLVGDTVWDVEASGRAGVACIGVLSGGVSEAELRQAGAVAVYQDVAQLRDELESSPLSALWR
jgi:phosphoglycolate phosphatase-like HAD superfamily hydrolase